MKIFLDKFAKYFLSLEIIKKSAFDRENIFELHLIFALIRISCGGAILRDDYLIWEGRDEGGIQGSAGQGLLEAAAAG